MKRKIYAKLKKNESILDINNNIVINLSSYKLKLHELLVLNKGLGFVPSHLKPKYEVVNTAMLRFERKLQLYYSFKNKEDNNSTRILETNSTWWPKNLNGHITRMCNDIKVQLWSSLNLHKIHRNLSSKEIKALTDLKKNKSIIIKKSDKGGGIAVMNSCDYLTKIANMLSDVTTYKCTNIDDTAEVKSLADKLIVNLGDRFLLNKKQVVYLTNFVPKCPIFYGLPKVHKANVPLRPICSQIDGPTCRINALVDKYLTVAENNIPYLLQDTTAYLSLIERYKTIKPGCILCTMDVTSLYTNIPHEEGAQWVCQFYEETLNLWDDSMQGLLPVDIQTLRQLIMFILNNCTFEFNGNKYAQLFGTTMGAKFSVKFANIYMHMWLRRFIGLYSGVKPDFVARLIDDCFFIWEHSLEELLLFIEYLNQCHSSIKFEAVYSTDKVCFLDTVTYTTDGLLHTTVYTKPTDRKQYLHFNSSHPKHTMLSIPYSQCIRYKRIIDTTDLLSSELTKLCTLFTARGYPTVLLDDTVARIASLNRTELLKYKTKADKKAAFNVFLKGRDFIPCILPFHQAFDVNLKGIINKNWTSLMNKNEKIAETFKGQCPQIVFSRGNTIGGLLCSSKFVEPLDELDRDIIEDLRFLSYENESDSNFKVNRCNAINCKCCAQLRNTSTFSNSNKTAQFDITHQFTCNSSDVIYVIDCGKCSRLYVGQTGRKLKYRMNGHRSDIKLKKNTAISIHFNSPNHGCSDVFVTPIFDITGIPQSDRFRIENYFMRKLDTLYPIGMNHLPIVS
jgi:hypothetical protein